MNHVIPPGTVLVERDPVKAAALIANNPDYVLSGTQSFSPHQRLTPRYAPNGHAVYWPRVLREYFALSPEHCMLDAMYGEDRAIAYVGERISPAGHRRMVIVPIADVNFLEPDFEFSWVLVKKPISAWGADPNPVNPPDKFRCGNISYIKSRLEPGVADAADRSHISLSFCTVNHEPAISGTYELYLQDDDTIRVVVNETPAKAP